MRNVVRKAWNTVLKATEKHTQAGNSERCDGLHVIVDTDNTRMTARRLVNELLGALCPCHSDVQLCRPTSVVEMAQSQSI
jgi:hypothetical protein